MRLLELFSGTGSVGLPFRRNNHEVIAVDIDSRFGCEIQEDILQLDYTKLPTPDVIWASCPCDQYSPARTRAKTPRNLALADSLVARTLEIIEHFQKLNPALMWFIENGNTTMLWRRPVAKDLTKFVVLDYCQYNSPGYRKRTRIAHSENIAWALRKLCDPKTCPQCIDGKHLLTAQQGPGKLRDGKRRRHDTVGLDTLHGLPEELTHEILKVCENHQWEVV